MSDPDRLQGDALVEALRADAPSPEQSGAMWKAIAAQGAVASAASSASAAKVAATLAPKALGLKIAAVLVVTSVGAAGLVYTQTRPAPRPASMAPKRPAPSVDPVRLAPREEQTCVANASCAQAPRVEATAPVVKSAPAKRARHVVAASPVDTLQTESRMLAQARAQLRARDLAGAEQTLRDARDQFPQGALGQEREVMQIELLAALGDLDGADHRARRFLRKHPDSPHVKSVRRFLIEP